MYDQTRTLNENVIMFIEALEDNQPKDMIVTEYTSTAEGVTLTGNAETYDSIAKLIVQLKQIECIENAFVTTIDEVEDSDTGKINYTFSLQCNYVSMVEEAEDELGSETDDATLQAE